MDPSKFTPYSASNGLPQESKLATYMNHSMPTATVNQAMANLNLESSPPAVRNVKTREEVLSNEFVPMNYYTPGNMVMESPRSSSPLYSVKSTQIHQENVGGTTYFYSTSDSLNASGAMNSSASLVGAESSMGVNITPSTAPPYVPQMYPITQPHMVPKPIGADSNLGVNVGGSAASPFGTQMFTAISPHMGPIMPKPIGAESGMGVNVGRNASPYGMPIYTPPHLIAKPVGAESCLGVNIAPSYGPQIYTTTQPHIGQMTQKSVSAEPCMGVNVGSGTMSPYGSQIYTTPPPLIGHIVSKSGLKSSFCTSDVIREEICQRNEGMFLHRDIHQYPELPENVEMFSELVPLEANGHLLTSTYRATHRQSGESFVLRRLHSYSSMPTKRMDIWKQIDHSNIVRLHEYFITQAFGDRSLVLVYDYHPACVTLMSKYMSGNAAGNSSEANGAFLDPFSSDPDAPRPYTHQKNTMLRAVASGALLPEAELWSLLIQLTAALRTIHSAGLACRTLYITKLVMSGCRVRIAWCGVADALHPNANDVTQAQQDDLAALGRLALVLACRTLHCDNLSACLDLVSRTYSSDLKNLIMYLLSNTTTRRCINDLMPMIGARFYTQIENLERRADVFEEQFAQEMDNSRLLRILIKLGIVNERPELNMDQSWSETGNRYMLKLFRDYLFHSVTEDGRPWIDQAHLTHCLNQLDSGTNTKVELMSRDEQSVLVVTYSELKHCLEQAYEEVMQTISQNS